VDDDVVRRVELLAVPGIGQDSLRAVKLVADDAAVQMLAGDLAALGVEGVAVAVAGRISEDGDVAVLVQPPKLAVVRDVAPDEVAAGLAPGRAFHPESAGPEPLDRGVALTEGGKPGIEDDDVGIGVALGQGVRTVVAAGASHVLSGVPSLSWWDRGQRTPAAVADSTGDGGARGGRRGRHHAV
jgi:hypothetical protein